MRAKLMCAGMIVLSAGTIAYGQDPHASLVFKKELPVANIRAAYIGLNSSNLIPAAIRFEHAEMWRIGGDDYKSSRRYKNALQTRNEGIGLTAAGATCLLGGSPLLAAGIINMRNDVNNPNSGLNNGAPNLGIGHIAEVLFGVLFTGAGVGMTAPGAILLSKGIRRMKKAKEDLGQ